MARRWLAVATTVAVAAFAVLVLAPVLNSVDDRAARATATASGTPTAATTVTAAAAASTSPPGTFESAVFGYRITLPQGFRRVRSVVVTDHPQILGTDGYTTATEAEAQAECLRDLGDMPSASSAWYVGVDVRRMDPGTSLMDWARNSPYKSPRASLAAATIDGRDAVRFVEDGTTSLYAIAGAGRIYIVSPTMWPTALPIEAIAASFRVIPPQPFPTPTPVPPLAPQEYARQTASALATAFASRDADAVARLMPPCHIGVGFYIDGMPSGGVLNRSVPLFIQELRARFARGDLAVTVNSAPQVQSDGGGQHFYVPSEWREADRSVSIDLFLQAEADGHWIWYMAMHHYTRQEIGPRGCIPLRSPWNSALYSSC